ncbi:GSCOCG00011306001-RA-CDS [Cotesia congregata]|nr:GSCOCG00011306001-RA-CDS [Cotesia congregata]
MYAAAGGTSIANRRKQKQISKQRPLQILNGPTTSRVLTWCVTFTYQYSDPTSLITCLLPIQVLIKHRPSSYCKFNDS